MKESDLLEPINDYGISKATATLFCQSVARREKLTIATLRLFSPYGYFESQARLIPSVIISCLNKTNPELSSPDSVRDFIFIDDVINAYTNVLENNNKIRGEIFNIGYGRQHTVGEIVNKIIVLIGYKVKPIWKSVPNPRIEPFCWQADTGKAKETLNWRPRHNLDAGLTKAISWFKKNLSLYRDSCL
jgi:nucleoside-diphosphate-sugar epimerase